MVAPSSSSSYGSSSRLEYSKIGIDVRPPAAHRRSYGGSACCLIAFVAASIAVGSLLLFIILRSPPPRPTGAHLSPSPSPLLSQPLSPSPSPHPSFDLSPSPSPSPSPSLSSTLISLCNATSHSQLCLQTLSSFPSAPTAPLQQLLALFASVALDHVNQTYSFALNFTRTHASDPVVPLLQDCLELMDSGKDELSNSIALLSQLDRDSPTFHSQVRDVQVWLSASYTDQDTCTDDFQDATGDVKDRMVLQGNLISNLISIALSLAETLQASSQNSPVPAPGPMRT